MRLELHCTSLCEFIANFSIDWIYYSSWHLRRTFEFLRNLMKLSIPPNFFKSMLIKTIYSCHWADVFTQMCLLSREEQLINKKLHLMSLSLLQFLKFTGSEEINDSRFASNRFFVILLILPTSHKVI